MSRQGVDTVDNRVSRKEAAQILSISQRTLDRHIRQKRLTSRKVNGRVWLSEADIMRFKKKLQNELIEGVNSLDRRHRDARNDKKSGIINIDTSRHGVSTLSRHVSTSDDEIDEEIEMLSQELQQVLNNDRLGESGVRNFVMHDEKSIGTDFAQHNQVSVNDHNTSHKNVSTSIENTSLNGAYYVQDSHGNSFLYTPLKYAPQEAVESQYAAALQYSSNRQAAVHSPLNHYYSEGIYQKLYEELKEEHQHNQKRIEAANYKVGQLEAQLGTMVPLLEYKKQQNKHKKLELGLRTQVRKRELQLKKARRMLNSEKLNKWVLAILALGLIAAQPIIWLMQK